MKRCKYCKSKLPKDSHPNKKFCNTICSSRAFHKNKRSKQLYRKRIDDAQELHYKDNDLIAYDNEIIECKESPTGKAYIGIAKLPLMENANGIGYQGVKLQSENRELIMCYECGNWVRTLSSGHLKQHNITVAEYKERYGFNKRTGMVPDAVSILLTKGAENGLLKHPASKRKYPITIGHGKSNTGTREFQNRYGTCPEQLKTAIINYVKRFHRLPNSHSHKDGFNKYKSILNRFGSMNDALQECGLPTRHREGSVTRYMFPDGSFVFKPKEQDYESIYKIMLEKCPVLKD